MEKKYLVGIDAGTSSFRAACFDTEGHYLGSGIALLSAKFTDDGKYIQKEDALIEAFFESIRDMLKNTGVDSTKIAGISSSIAGYRPNGIDENHNQVFDILGSVDPRIWAKMGWVYERLGAAGITPEVLYDRVKAGTPCFMASLFQTLKETEPEKFASVWKWSDTPHGIMMHALGGDWVNTESIATNFYLYDPFTYKWDEEICKALEVGPDVFAEIRFGGEPCGIVSVEAAAKTGLAAGTKLFTGINDNISHCIVQGDADYPTAILGTFGIISMCLNHPVSDPQRICGIQGGFDKNDNWTLSTGIGGVGAMNTWLRENLCAHFAAEANEKGKDVYDILSEHAAMSPIGSHGLYCNPNILGASVDPFVKSSYLNLNLACTLNDIIRAAYEGIAYEIKKFVNIIDNCKGTKSTKLYVSGGCAQSDILVSIIADVLNIDICQSDVSPAHAGVMGAAMIAGIGAGIFKDIDEAKVKMARPGKTVKPTPENVEVYKNLFETYLTCYDGLANHVYTKPL